MSIEVVNNTLPHLETSRPQRVTIGALGILLAYGLLLWAPLLLSAVAISVIKFGVWTFLLPLAAVGAGALFLPCGVGNPHVVRLVQTLYPDAARSQDAFIVQATLSPRLCHGLRALLEDADDFGCLTFTDCGLLFRGDALQAFIPFKQIRAAERRSIGWRGLFLGKQRIVLKVAGLPGAESLEFAERSSWTLPASHATSRRLHAKITSEMTKTKEI